MANNIRVTSATANAKDFWQIQYILTGLTLGQKYYIDPTEAADIGGTCTLTNIKLSAVELG
jgi:hypothetical protein